jgi:putative SOS response-associated peptidase YedK
VTSEGVGGATMCGRMVLTRSAAEIAEAFELETTLELAARYNIAPSQPIAAVRVQQAGRELTMLHWGLIPSWAREKAIGNRMINARSETAAEKPAFRAAMRQRRCIVPADGFYEWQGAGGKSGTPKVPHLFRRRGGAPLAIAGLYEAWTDHGSGEVVESCSLLTTEANATVRPVHHRMPVLLERRDFSLWLDPEVNDTDRLQSLLVPCAPDRLEAIVVSSHVNDPRNEDPGCIEPVS